VDLLPQWKKTIEQSSERDLCREKTVVCSELPERCFVITVDVDSWASLLRFYGVEHDRSEADFRAKDESGTLRLVNLFEKHGILVTFFVPGEVARSHPDMVRLLCRRGHEVACHGLMHLKNECLLERVTQEEHIRKATQIIKEITGIKPVGFRAPCLRANKDTIALLSENGYLYDSSTIPTFIPGYYGNLDLRFKPYWWPLDSPVDENRETFLEIPVSVNPLMLVPLSAAWLRNLGGRWVRFGIKMNFLLHNPVVLYVHPRDVLPLPKVRGIPWHLYRNTGSATLEILDKVISYAKTLGATFLKATDLANALHESEEEVS